jgi:quinol monooxygenase YgiN
MIASRWFTGDILTYVLVVARLRPTADETSFRAEVRAAIEALATRPGHVSTRLARALDDPTMWVLVSEWINVGSYRRALSSYDVKMASGILMGAALPEPSAYEVLESHAPGGDQPE